MLFLAPIGTVAGAVIGAVMLGGRGCGAPLGWVVGYPIAVFVIVMAWATTRSSERDDSCAGAVTICFDNARDKAEASAFVLALAAFLVAGISAFICAGVTLSDR
jgi:hypothetical protein